MKKVFTQTPLFPKRGMMNYLGFKALAKTLITNFNKRIMGALCLIIIFSGPLSVSSQELEAENTQELSKDARKGELVSFEFNEDEQSYYLVFLREKGKKKIYETYIFDKDLKLTSNETFEEKDKSKRRWKRNIYKDPGVPWENRKVVRIGSNPTQITLRLGTLSRDWVCNSSTAGNYTYTTCQYQYDFKEEKTVKPKYKPSIDFPAGTPKPIQKLVLKLCEKVAPIYYMTDEPETDFEMNPIYSASYGSLATTDFSKATGNVVVAGYQQYNIKEDYYGFIKLLKYSAKDLSLINETNVRMMHPNHCFFKKILPDHSMVLVFMPQKFQKGGLDPNTENFTYMRVSDDATLLGKVNFTSPNREWVIADAVLGPDGEVYLYGMARDKKNGKYALVFQDRPLGKADKIQVVKINGDQVDYITNVSVDEMAAKVAKPANQKKAKAYKGKDLYPTAGAYVLSPDGQLIFGGQTKDHSTLFYFHFAADGSFKKQYVIYPEEKHKEVGVDHAILMNSDQKSATLYIGELADIDNERHLKYPRMGTMDFASGTMGEMKAFGYGKSGKYYLDSQYPITFVGADKLVFFSHDKKDKEIWLGKVKLGK